MMRMFRRYILGGKSDKTEGTLFAFLIGVVWISYAVVQTARGVDMEAAWPFLTAYALTTVAAFTGATVVQHLKPPAPPQEPGQDGQGRYLGGGWTPEDERGPAPPHSGPEGRVG